MKKIRYLKRYGLLLLSAVLSVMLGSCVLDAQAFAPAHEIHVVSREDGSGTRGAFTELTGIAKKDENGEVFDHTTLEAIITNSTSVVMTTVAGDSHAIGYLSLGSMNNTLKGLLVDGVAPTAENIKEGSYPIARPFLLATGPEQDPLISDFIRFIQSEEGQTIVEDMGYVSYQPGNAYQSEYLAGKIVVGGSSSVTPVMEKLKEAYQHLQPDVIIEVQQSDSTTGMASVANGTYDIGMASRSLKDSEREEGLVEQTIALDGIVVVVSPENPMETIALEQVKQVFRGDIHYWNELEEDA